ncbi:hypothetical protein G3I40_13985 [Streptomyces sp. SID14478]|uniref:hypothetical protein n=1 Tax=Streptomyces sp. SID14478 TaxID=2706073 RepID=UPI0013DB4D61|nr:hypothetical protein [Streptomyces sp. SID14478]NEB76324.1 hypothetical protein [Streptomyces sp. SID14478]
MDDLGYKPITLSVDKAREETSTISSQILDLIAIKEGKVTEPGPGVSTCDEDPGHLYKTRHPWSIYQVSSEDVLKQGFERLRKQLPQHGWKIVRYGHDNSKAKTLGLTADSTTKRFSINVELLVSSPTAGKEKEPLLAVTVVSGCFRAPEGTDLNKEY